MATGWVKSLQCKSRAVNDVVHHHITTTVSSCRRSVSLNDVVEPTKQNPRKMPKQPPPPRQPSSDDATRRRRSRAPEAILPALTELPGGHPSRNVVEIIFHTRWSPKAFSGRVEMVFKVQNLPRTVTRFEEYRERVKSRAAAADGVQEDHARCRADGNEVMRFHCLGSTGGDPGYDAGCGASWRFHGGKGTAICTYAESGRAHESAGGGRGRRAMLVCRVIAGRVCKRVGLDALLEERKGFDSVSGNGGELLVFDSRAVLPCFLIIYKL
ncbi:uncharacterized protein LOC127787002 [Diospyros lotus]|uniref:uncharacterized protein LOC127787002 n=1 Tax=Diospyros lotus TaxID=55363 RepID=UPI002250F18E|nr:uncharacterized protein LOC127787002 [Diospyros lotus]